MNARFVHALLLAALTFTMNVDGFAQAAPATQIGAEQEVRRLSDEEVQGFLHQDPGTMARIWSDDLVVTNPLNKFVTKQQVLDMMKSGYLVISAYDRQIEYARVYGDDTVILAGPETVTWGGRMPNAGKVEHLRFTAVWRKQKGRWQEVARHANIVPQP